MERIRAKLAQRERENRIDGYKPYHKQKEFHAAGLKSRERLFRAGNQQGKCATIATLIDTPYGRRSVGDLLIADKPFEVLAWDGDRPVKAWASQPFQKFGEHHCYRLTMADGQWVEVADYHRVLCDGAWVAVCDILPMFGLSPPRSSSECARLIHGASDLDWSQTPSGLPDHYSEDCRQYGEQLLSELGSVPEFPPLSGGALERILDCWREGDCRLGPANNPYSDTGRHSTLDGLPALAGRSFGSLVPTAYKLFQRCLRLLQGRTPPVSGSASGVLSTFERLPSCLPKTLYQPSPVSICAGNHIVSCEYIGSQKVYDFEVAGWHNYCAGGLIHHNTLSGGAECAFHASGEYPEWWQGARIDQPNNGWVGAPSGELVRDGAQNILLGPPGEWGTGMIPKRLIEDITRAQGIRDGVDTVVIKHVNGGLSRIKFKSYDQGRERWQTATLNWVWFDEEPPEDIYMEGLSRTNATGGFVWMTFTPLLGVSSVVMRFLKERSKDRADIVMTIEDALHISEEARQRIIDSYPEHEREARTRGVPILGSGRVFPFPRALLVCDAFPIPKHWARIGGMDIGWDHPTAAVLLAHDRDGDIVYVTECYKARETTVSVHAGALVPWGRNLPWAWPHDAFQHDKGSGQQIAKLYRDHGLNMLEEHAQFADDRGNGVEAGIFDMVDRMQTGRLKVFEHLNEWFEEFELYHRKDGKIVKERDDALAATRYALMMLRHARLGPQPFDPYARSYGGRSRGKGSAMAA